MKSTIIFVLASISSLVSAQSNPDRVAAVTCAVLKETRNMDSSYRVEKVNEAREKIDEAPYLLGDRLIKESIEYGTCELLVKNHPEWQIITSVEGAKITQAFFDKNERIAAKNEIEAANRAEYYNDNRMIFLPNIEINDDQKYKNTTHKFDSVEISRVFSGETLNGEYEGYYADCFVPKFSHQSEPGMGGLHYQIKGDVPICKRKETKKGHYWADYYTQEGGDNGYRYNWMYTLKIKKDKIKICQKEGAFSFGCIKDKTINDISLGTGFVFKAK